MQVKPHLELTWTEEKGGKEREHCIRNIRQTNNVHLHFHSQCSCEWLWGQINSQTQIKYTLNSFKNINIYMVYTKQGLA